MSKNVSNMTGTDTYLVKDYLKTNKEYDLVKKYMKTSNECYNK